MLHKIEDTVKGELRKNLKVLEKGETRRDATWRECVDEAKILLKMTHESRMKIVALAEKCCTIHQGGRSTDSRYTLTRFAKDIGMNKQTLLEWYRLKKNVADNLTEAEQKSIKQTDMIFFDRQLKGIPRGSEEYKSALKKKVKQFGNGKSETTRKMMKYNQYLTSILFNVKNKAMIKGCDRTVLAEMLHKTREISKNLNWVDFEVKEKTNGK
jgi:hypothetical protein